MGLIFLNSKVFLYAADFVFCVRCGEEYSNNTYTETVLEKR